jgi:hypothetical protein
MNKYIRFANRLLKLEKEVKLTIYNDMPHGFLSFDIPVHGME